VLNLGHQPLANSFLSADALREPELRVPLHFVRCGSCGLGQLTHVVDPEVMYGEHYVYRSGYSDGWRQHCDDLAGEVGFPGARTLDIGCLDGVMMCMLHLRDCQVRGCDPSAPGSDPLVVRELFGANTRIGEFDVITAQNVFGHVDDARGFLEGVAANLAPNGTAIIECPWIVDLIEKGAWDTIYHEHVSYWGLQPLAKVARKAGLSVTHVRHFPHLHGGTMRYYLKHKGIVQDFNASICEAWYSEEELDEAKWAMFSLKAESDVKRWAEYFHTTGTKQVMGYGAAAKFNTLLNALPERPKLLAIFDETPSKQGKFTPGWHIPVLAPTELAMSRCDELVVGAPNWRDEIERKARVLGFRGEVKVPWQ
jgi:hypothetical protein